jgi:hypothetical protein
MPQICINGWSPGLRKVSHTDLLRAHAGMSLGEAKAATDRVLAGQEVVFSVTSQTQAAMVVAEFVDIGARAAIAEK